MIFFSLYLQAVFLLPCRLKHPDGSGQLLGGRSGRSGGYVSYKDTPIVVDGDDDDDESGSSHGGGGSKTRHVHREYVLEGYVLSLRRLIGTALCRYAVPVLEQQRLLECRVVAHVAPGLVGVSHATRHAV